MKIALVHSFYRSQIPSGENLAVSQQLDALLEKGHEVRLFARSSDDITDSIFQKIRVGVNVTLFSGASPLTEIQAWQPDIVHVHNLFPNFGYQWLREIKVPVVATLHNFRPLCANGLFLREGKACFACLEKGTSESLKFACYRDSKVSTLPLTVATRNKGIHNPLLRYAKTLIALSPESKTIFQRARPSLNIEVLANFSPEPEHSSLHTSDDWDGFVYVGRLSAEKGIQGLLNEWPDAVPLAIIGTGPLESELRKKHDRENITFLGQLGKTDVLAWMAKSKALVFPSLCLENSPLVYPEALSLGVPVIAKTTNSVAARVQDERTGETYSNQDSLLAALDKVSVNRKVYMSTARNTFEAKYNKSAWLEGLEKIYRGAMS